LKTGMKLREGEDIPFGPPPEEYNYRCLLCGCEVWVNEAIIDFELGFAAFEGREPKMPVIGCPDVTERQWNTLGSKARPKGANLSRIEYAHACDVAILVFFLEPLGQRKSLDNISHASQLEDEDLNHACPWCSDVKNRITHET
jgi:hypothetical protein